MLSFTCAYFASRQAHDLDVQLVVPSHMSCRRRSCPSSNFFANASFTIATCRRRVVAPREVAPREQRHAEHVEKVRADGVVARPSSVSGVFLNPST